MARPKRILVVDDDPRNRNLLKGMLESLNLESVLAHNGLDALEKVKDGVDLVLLDVLMPDMDGFEVVRRIRADPEISDIPVVMVTILESKEHKLQAVEAGANDFISKPVDRLELRVRLKSLLRMKEAVDALKEHGSRLETTVKKRTAALRESEGRFRTLFENAQDCIFIKDLNLRYVDVNSAITEFLGLPVGEILGKTDYDLFAQDYARQFQEVEQRVLEGQTVEMEQRVTYRSRTMTLDYMRFPMCDSAGEINGLCGIVRDMTGREGPVSVTPSSVDRYRSGPMRATLDALLLAAETDSTILLTGESGSGKDYLARSIHDHSKRSGGPFYSINCAAISPELAESELFGHEAGAFTGAGRRKRGLVELAEGGTLLLNEIGELALPLQSKLLSFLDSHTLTRVGGEKSVTVNARIIAATNRNLEEEVALGRFRGDLYYRLNVFSIKVPPLRDRAEDIPDLISKITAQLKREMQLPNDPKIGREAMERLQRYTWPGNVRELRNVLERAFIHSRGEPVAATHLGLEDRECVQEFPQIVIQPTQTLSDVLDNVERSLILDALQRAEGKKHEAARILGISRFKLTRDMTKLGIAEQ
ncbi:MAG: sigma 54-interacting transcriptional regulator [Thermodesulfobacteriota bacterium]